MMRCHCASIKQPEPFAPDILPAWRTMKPSSAFTCILAASMLLAITAQPDDAATAASDNDDDGQPKLCQGTTAAKVLIDSVLPYPPEGSKQAQTIVLRNFGGQTANLTGWRLTDSETQNTSDAKSLDFDADIPGCEGLGNFTIEPSRTLTLTPKSAANPCGFPFTINFRDEVNLLDPTGAKVSAVSWQSADMGTVLRLQPDLKTYRAVPETKNVLETLAFLGGYDTFVAALKATGLDKLLSAPDNPAYINPTKPGPRKAIVEAAPNFPWWFGFGVDRSKLAPPPPPPPPAPFVRGIPPAGPYTILAPSDEAFEKLARALGAGHKLSKEQLFNLPELKEILQYHIVPGRYTTAAMYNNSAIGTAMGVPFTPFNDPCMTEGTLMLHDNCVDKPTPDNYTCDEQKDFDKCYFPFMTSALAAQWQGGFCQMTCERCSCAPGSGIQCAKVVIPDVLASNGIIQGISRVMFPPPSFNKSMYINTTIDPELASALASATPQAVPQGAPPAPAAEGAAPPTAAGAAAPPPPVSATPSPTAPPPEKKPPASPIPTPPQSGPPPSSSPDGKVLKSDGR